MFNEIQTFRKGNYNTPPTPLGRGEILHTPVATLGFAVRLRRELRRTLNQTIKGRAKVPSNKRGSRGVFLLFFLKILNKSPDHS